MDANPAVPALNHDRGRLYTWLMASVPIVVLIWGLYSWQQQNMVVRPLAEAVLSDDVDSVRALLNRGANVHAATKYGCSTLLLAAENDAATIARYPVDPGKPKRLAI